MIFVIFVPASTLLFHYTLIMEKVWSLRDLPWMGRLYA